MQIPILKGTYATAEGDYATRYPRNNVPVPKPNGISNGQFRPSEGIEYFGAGPGTDRGAINWNGKLYRVMGEMLVYVSSVGKVVELGSVGNGGLVTMTYSFDYLAIASGGNLFLYNKATGLNQVTDEDLGTALDVLWIDGYFVTTDGEFLVVGELSDPFEVNIFRYGSSEINPDPIVGLAKVSNEVYAVNRYSIEVYNNVGGTGFPFQRIEGAAIERGAVGVKAFAVYEGAVAFIGGALDEAPAVWIGASGQDSKLSTREIDDILSEYTEDELSRVKVETRSERNHKNLYIHLPNQTLVYDAAATSALSMPIWYTLDSGLREPAQYRAWNVVYCYDKWISGDPTSNSLGIMVRDKSSHYGEIIGWDIWTTIVFNETKGFVIHEMELTGLTGRIDVAADPSPTIATQYSKDGLTFSRPKAKSLGVAGERLKRLKWTKQGHSRAHRSQHFYGTSQGHIGMARLDVTIEGCAY